MIEFPALVYKDKGKYDRKGGTYDFTGVQNAEELASRLANGWFLSLEEAINPVVAAPVKQEVIIPDDSAAPTRVELETKATELGIKFDGRYSDKRISQLIDEALAN